MNTALALQLAILLVTRSQEIMTLINAAQAQGRDLTDDEVASVRAGAVASNEALKALG